MPNFTMSRQAFMAFLLGTPLVVLNCVLATASQLRVTVEQGVLEGTTETFLEDKFTGAGNTKVDVFKGVPFAEPPLGPLRFKPPVKKAAWDEVYNATYYRPACLQDPQFMFGLELNEDCLHLNVFAPNRRVVGGAAVMVWIHGGGFVIGSATEMIYNGLPLAAVGDVIVVTINYRLGVFGFLSTGDDASPGNVALLDNVLALKWVQQNIEAFGGDKQRVTIFGESAGAIMVGFLVLSEMAKGLFSQAIVQSNGPISLFIGPLTEKGDSALRQKAFQLGETVGCSATDGAALIHCLQDVDTGVALIRAQLAVYGRMYPVVDGTFLTMTPLEAYASGNYNNVPMLVGSNADEGTYLFAENPMFAEYLTQPDQPRVNRTLFDALLASRIKSLCLFDNYKALSGAIKMRYIDWSQAEYQDADYFHSIVQITGDMGFSCTVDIQSRLHSSSNEVYRYVMTHVPTMSFFNQYGEKPGPRWLGAGHAEDLSFVFGAAFTQGSPWVSLTDDEKALSVKIMKLWTNFAKNGNPSKESPDSAPTDEYMWPLFSSPSFEYKVLDLNLSMSRAYRSDQCYFWNSYVDELQTLLDNQDGDDDSGVFGLVAGVQLVIVTTICSVCFLCLGF